MHKFACHCMHCKTTLHDSITAICISTRHADPDTVLLTAHMSHTPAIAQVFIITNTNFPRHVQVSVQQHTAKTRIVTAHMWRRSSRRIQQQPPNCNKEQRTAEQLNVVQPRLQPHHHRQTSSSHCKAPKPVLQALQLTRPEAASDTNSVSTHQPRAALQQFLVPHHSPQTL